jgi:hypothetical protein
MPATTRLKKFFLKGKRALAGAATSTRSLAETPKAKVASKDPPSDDTSAET